MERSNQHFAGFAVFVLLLCLNPASVNAQRVPVANKKVGVVTAAFAQFDESIGNVREGRSAADVTHVTELIAEERAEGFIGLPMPIPPGTPVYRARVESDGAVTPLEGSVAGVGTLVYSNVLGPFVFGPGGAVATSRIADDITTVGLAGCPLEKYVIRVTGDRLFDGAGAGLDYAVKAALWAGCPGAGGEVIPGSFAEFTIPAAEAGGISEREIFPSQPVFLPQSFYLSLRFSRDHCGTVAGAPANLGFSGDRLDFPGTACSAGLGGFPNGPHASFYTEVYTSVECPASFPAYKNSNNAGASFSAGINKPFADIIQLGVPDCNFKAWEISHKGNGIIQANLRTSLDNADPDNGGVIPGTSGFCFSSGGGVQICRHEVAEAIPLTQSTLFMGFVTNSTATGPIMTCKQSLLGETPNLIMVSGNNGWEARDGTENCWFGFDITIFCEGAPPAGACCDMAIPDHEGEAVCRDLIPEMNCPFPEMWVQDKRCAPACVGGDNANELCVVDDCPGGSCVGNLCVGGPNDGSGCARDDCPDGSCVGSFCDGGTYDGEPCSREADCPGGSCTGSPFFGGYGCGLAACCKPDGAVVEGCENMTRNECFAVTPTENPRLFARTRFCGENQFSCPIPACISRRGECTLERAVRCEGGFNDGEICNIFAPPGVVSCYGICVDGNDGAPCTQDSSCSPGTCEGAHNCVGQPGCQDPFCCTDVCERSTSCCEIHWGENCATLAATYCPTRPGNDECAPTRPDTGARLIQIPGVYEGDGVKATSSSNDPGFCCHNGIEGDPTAGPGSRGVNTIWYKFVANVTSAEFATCCSATSQGPADDSLLQIFAVADPDRGVCSDGLTACSLSGQDCGDGSDCVPDPDYECGNLVPIGCSDDSFCTCNSFPEPLRSKVCVKDLVIGDTYYVIIAAKTIDNVGRWKLRLSSPCTADDPLPNDFCTTAEVPDGQELEANYPLTLPFDLSGETTNTAAATFDCPGPLCGGSGPAVSMQNDIWFDWTSPCDGTATVETCGFDPNTGAPRSDLTPDTGLVLYEGCGCPVQIAHEIDCDDFNLDPCFLGAAIRNMPVLQGQCYKIRLGGHLGDTPSGELTVTLVCDGNGDCNGNGIPDHTEIAAEPSLDCNASGVLDECELADGTSRDCNGNMVPDECDPDCNGSGIPDECDISDGTSLDCNDNGLPDECDLADGTSRDCNGNMVPDECDPDCNGSGIPDECDISDGTSLDCNDNGLPDECDLADGTSQDCNSNLAPDECDPDCNGSGFPDECDVSDGTSADCNDNRIPDECEPDCNANSVPDDCELADGSSLDCNDNAIPDDCDISNGTSADCNDNGTPDECEPDCNANNVPDDCELADGSATDRDQDGIIDECDDLVSIPTMSAWGLVTLILLLATMARIDSVLRTRKARSAAPVPSSWAR